MDTIIGSLMIASYVWGYYLIAGIGFVALVSGGMILEAICTLVWREIKRNT